MGMKLLKLVPDDTNIGFLKWRNIAMGISILMIIGSFALVAAKGLNFGVDFVGGQMIQVTFADREEAPITELRESIGKLGYGEATIQRFGEPNQVSIRMRLPEEAVERPEAANEMTAEIVGLLKTEYGVESTDSVDSVSGKVSEELLSKGVWSLVGAMMAISL